MSGPNDITVKLGVDDSSVPQPVARVNAAILSIGKAGEISARQTAAAMRQLPAQFTDIATQLAGGQSPLLVLLQQGGQIKDSFGGIGPALRGLSAAITPTTLAVGGLAAGVGVLSLAAVQGARESSQLRDTIALTGNAAGLTGARLQALGEQVAAASQQTVAGSKQIVLDLASSGQVSNRVLASAAEAVARVADVSGEDAKKIAGDFSTMAGGVAKWAAEHNKAWNFITVEQYKYIRGLEEQGRAEEAMIFVNQKVRDNLADQQKNLGLLETAWDGVRKFASGAWDAMLGVGRETSTRQKLDIELSRLEALGGNLQPKARKALEQRIQFLKEQLKLENQQADARSRNAAANRKAIDDERKNEGKAPQFPFGAIRDGREQERQDFLRSEKAAYGELEKARKEADEQAAKDERSALLQRFKDDKEEEDRQRRRLDQAVGYLQSLQDANAHAGAELLADERERGEALIRLDRDIARRRVQEQGLEGGARDEAYRLIDEQALLRRQQLEVDLRKSSDRLAEETGQKLYDDTRQSISAAFRDTHDPVRAFGDALANTIYTRATASLIDALATAAVGANGQGGALGNLLGLLGSINGGGMTVDTAGYGIGSGRTDGGVGLPTRGGMATGTNYVPRNMVTLVHEGEAIVPKKYNPAAGGSGGRGGIVYAPNVQLSIDARSDREQIAGLVFDAMARSQRAFTDELRARGINV